MSNGVGDITVSVSDMAIPVIIMFVVDIIFCLTNTVIINMLHTTASIWLTMYLGINRYLGVCHPFVMRRRCNTKTTVETIFFIYVLSVLFHLCRFIDTKYVPEYTGSNVTNITCSARHADWLNDREKLYECIYHWCHIVCICVIPCATLVLSQQYKKKING
jgi:hypothetical protein